MFGGYTAGGFLGDTWTWDGHAWAKHSPAHSPRARGAPAMAYDPLRRLVVMIGGTVKDQGEGTATDEIWTWDGADWAQELMSSVRPPARASRQAGPSLGWSAAALSATCFRTS
jgi:hypothetical protein